MKKNNKTPLAVAMGTAVVSAFTATAANAEANPFSMTELSEGYMQVAGDYNIVPWGGESAKKQNEASCGEGKCGGMMDGDKMKKGLEQACGSMMKGNEGACGAMDTSDNKAAEAKCGEGKCGTMDMGDGKIDTGEKKSGGMDMKGGGMGGMDGMDMKGGGMSCGAMMEKMKMKKMKGKMGDMKGMDMGGMDGMDMSGKKGGMNMKGGEQSCGSKIDPDKAAGQ